MGRAGTALLAIVLAFMSTAAHSATDADWATCFGTNPEKAIPACTKIIDDKNESGETRAAAYSGRGQRRADKGDRDGAIADYSQAIKLKPINPNAYYFRGNRLTEKGEYDLAVADYTQAIKLAPTDVDLYSARAYCHSLKGRHDLAIIDYNTAIELRPTASLYRVRGNVFHTRKDYDSAISDHNKSIALDPDNADSYMFRGFGYDAKGRFDEAIADYSKAIDIAPRNVSALYFRGNSYATKGLRDRAISDLSRALEIEPTYISAYIARASIYLGSGDVDRAILDYDQIIKLNPKNAGAYSGRGIAYIAKGDRQRAIADYARAETLPIDEKDTYQAAQQKEAREKLTALLAQPAHATASTPMVAPAPPRPPQRRFALLIANAAYKHLSVLKTPQIDVATLGKALTDVGFEVTIAHDQTRSALLDTLQTFSARVTKEVPDWALVYFSGHGGETLNGTYMLPTDVTVRKDGALLSDYDLEDQSIPVINVLKRLQGARGLRLVIHDACRDNPFISRFNASLRMTMTQAKSTGIEMPRATGMTLGRDIIIFATTKGTFAYDGTDGQPSPFVGRLATALGSEGLELETLYLRVAREVAEDSSKKDKLLVPQRPQAFGFPLEERHYFRPPKGP